MSPTVTPGPEVRRATATIDAQSGRNLSDIELCKRAPHHHLAGKFHAGGLQCECLDGRPPKTSQSAMKVLGPNIEEQPANEAQHRVSQIAVQERHRSRRDPALEAIAHDEIGTNAQPFQEQYQRRKVVAQVCVAHDHVAAVCSLDAPEQRGAISATLNMDDASTQLLRNGLGTICAA